MRDYTTIGEQNSFDLAVQQFGTLNNLDKVLRQMPDLNESTDFGVDMVFDDTENNLALAFGANNARFATGLDEDEFPSPSQFRTFDSTFNNTFY